MGAGGSGFPLLSTVCFLGSLLAVSASVLRKGYPNGGLFKYCPDPCLVFKTPSWYTRSPFSTVDVMMPLQCIPSKTLVSTAWWWVLAEMTFSALGSKTIISASDPGLIAPFLGYKLKI